MISMLGRERGGGKERKNSPPVLPSLKGTCLLHIVLINSIRLLTVRNTPPTKHPGQKPLNSVPPRQESPQQQSQITSIFHQSLLQYPDKPSHLSTFWLCAWTLQPLSSTCIISGHPQLKAFKFLT